MEEKKGTKMQTEKDKVYFVGVLPLDKNGSGNIQESAKKALGRHGDGEIKATGDNTAFYYRMHTGDENGQTYYKWGTVVVIDDENKKIVSDCKGVSSPKFSLSLVDEKNKNVGAESDSDWTADNGYVMTGRIHVGDENKPSNIISKMIHITLTTNGTIIELKQRQNFPQEVSDESDGTDVQHAVGQFTAPDGKPATIYLPITGRKHSGDEHGETTTTFSRFYFTLNENDEQID